jgi:hypothetical protein
MKTFTTFKKENKDLIYLLTINGRNIKLIKPYNSFSGTYGSLSLTVYDDAFIVLKNNLWLLDLEFTEDVPKTLKDRYFTELQASELQSLLYS